MTPFHTVSATPCIKAPWELIIDDKNAANERLQSY